MPSQKQKKNERKHIFSFIIYTSHTQKTNKSKTISVSVRSLLGLCKMMWKTGGQ